ncbi:hypothetical protein CLV59_107257 [Chitinophaga dinghuensis]|uniref:Uncharacterized protein n=1 Tax=Chitinophaga dinghuensis TaxID=1539050 RepID=A0A327VTV4_9BACT|nr:hypothetical protein CLV59_107257 [Chitinophaga dinghuensis]
MEYPVSGKLPRESDRFLHEGKKGISGLYTP